MIECICLFGMMLFGLALFYMQHQHAAERNKTQDEIFDLTTQLSRDTHEQQQKFLTEALGSMRAMYGAYVQPVLKAAVVMRASSAAEGVMAAGSLAQVDSALDPELQAKLMEIQNRVTNHTPFKSEDDVVSRIQREPPRVIQDPATGDVLTRM